MRPAGAMALALPLAACATPVTRYSGTFDDVRQVARLAGPYVLLRPCPG